VVGNAKIKERLMVKKIIVGLGNPDEEYANTYHNVGVLALKAIMQDKEEKWVKHKNLFEYLETTDAAFVFPLTYMNESGKAVREALKKFNAKPNDLIVLHDDSDITIGNFKTSFARNSAGHKGVQSIIDTLQTNAFTRVRIGIRPVREAKRQKAGDFALKQITPAHRKIFETVFAKITTTLPLA
jgi:PTH1 family peptidyl-tRNA hydrolase